MDPGKLPPVRTGLFPVANAASVEYVQRRLVSTVFVMVRSAARVSEIIAVHADRQVATSEDAIAALKYQAKTFLNRLDEQDTIDAILEMEKDLFGDGEDESVGSCASDTDESMPDLVSDDGDAPAVPPKNVVDGRCACEVCAGAREAVASWDSWVPSDETEEYLKAGVEKAIGSVEKEHQ